MSKIMKRLEAGRLRRQRLAELLRARTGHIDDAGGEAIQWVRVSVDTLSPGFYLMVKDRLAPVGPSGEAPIAFFRLEHPEGFPEARCRAVMDSFNRHFLGELANVTEVTHVDTSMLILRNPFTGKATPLNLTIAGKAAIGTPSPVQ